MHPFPTITTIVDDLLITLPQEDLDFIKRGEPGFGMVGRYIRNHYGLWGDHPLTAEWRAGKVDIRDGIDYSEGHPDNLSGRIVDELRRRLA